MTGKGDCFFKMHKHLHKTTSIHKELGNMTQPKEQSKFPVTYFKEFEIHKFPGKELKIIFLKNLCGLQENTN